MPEMNYTPTQRNYLEIQRTLKRVQQGHDLLEKKRQILVSELMTRVEAARRIKEQVNEAMQKAYRAERRAAARCGLSEMARLSFAARTEPSLSVTSHSVMGVPVPRIDCKPQKISLQFGLMAGASHVDQVMERFLEAAPLVAELAEVDNAVFRLAREVQRTRRRVNALEKSYIPQYKKVLKYIEEALAERRREEFIVLRKVKSKRQALMSGKPGKASFSAR
ncbi:MAG: V-type ATP synthase subunit D [Planctomycetes bacterium]|nr:V-type ATP synthase subunit D [Planctomycetota bacterium]